MDHESAWKVEDRATATAGLPHSAVGCVPANRIPGACAKDLAGQVVPVSPVRLANCKAVVAYSSAGSRARLIEFPQTPVSPDGAP
ncbi:hypothetical protein KGA66_08560 [Actinocrinis puniceicyclus]|uniref:Uncharacterized protein n=1 Tax=Actinocrinis puniceicyclus TaxID=977794 RepID=A0A8J7WKP9_9ACTN|nr:hypothetical protein [Actinocrinis puniceicyclus]MBS2963093.1 hypothetical protein [Actinocrinis puniceicyclus]